ncbi:MAG: DUF5597 domain-containing protein [Eubacteriales bacterium]|nr:DUF5597 domain-containing protein [Eubacteriales bacterium]
MNDFFRDRQGNAHLLVGLQSHNSSTGSEMIGRSIQAIRHCGGNLLEAPIYWNQIEPEEGVYDVSLLKDLIDQCREANLFLIPLWFATSKNGHPNYCPDYIKLNPQTYQLAIGPNGAPVPSLSPHCEATFTRDRLALTEVMRFLRDYDSKQGTVIALQLENEMGLSHTDRDYSAIACEDYARPVPAELDDVRLEDCGWQGDRDTWRGRFGRHAHEAFCAWHHARYIGRLAEAAKSVVDLPMITNVMIGEQNLEEAGLNYNGGGAVGRVLDIWKAGAPELDLICPDIYNTARSEYLRIARRYARPDNALFIPESPPAGDANAMNAILAVGQYGATGICCFGAESMLNNDNSLHDDSRSMMLTLKTIRHLEPLLIKYRDTGRIHAFAQEEFALSQYLRLDGYHVQAHFFRDNPRHFAYGSRINLRSRENSRLKEDRGRGLLIQTGAHEFYLAGAGMALELTRRPDPQDMNPYPHLTSRQATQLNFLSVEEGHFEQGDWVIDYIRNGDESNFAHYVHEGQVIRIRLNPQTGM